MLYTIFKDNCEEVNTIYKIKKLKNHSSQIVKTPMYVIY